MKRIPSFTYFAPMSLALALGFAGTGPALSHDLWANVFAETEASGTTSVVTAIGWGHSPRPFSEFVSGSRLAGYALIDPHGSVIEIPFDTEANTDPDLLGEIDPVEGLATLQGGDPFMRRIVLDDTAAAGSWRLHTGVPAAVRTTWIDAEDVTQAGAVYPDEITDALRIVSTAVTTRGASAYWTHGAWSEPVPSADVAVELLPLADLTVLGAGETVSVQLYRDGEAVSTIANARFIALDPSGVEREGEIDVNGLASIEIDQPGFWILRASHTEPVDEAGPRYAEFAGRIDEITFVTTLALDVAP